MDEDFIKNYALLDRYNVSRETCLDFEKFISMIKSENDKINIIGCLLYTSPSPRDRTRSRMPSSA